MQWISVLHVDLDKLDFTMFGRGACKAFIFAIMKELINDNLVHNGLTQQRQLEISLNPRIQAAYGIEIWSCS